MFAACCRGQLVQSHCTPRQVHLSVRPSLAMILRHLTTIFTALIGQQYRRRVSWRGLARGRRRCTVASAK